MRWLFFSVVLMLVCANLAQSEVSKYIRGVRGVPLLQIRLAVWYVHKQYSGEANGVCIYAYPVTLF